MKTVKLLLFLLTFTFVFQLGAQTVYTTKTGEKYHTSSCNYLKYSKKEYTLEKVIELGYEACSVCKPNKSRASKSAARNTLKSKNIASKNTPNKKAIASQCTGKTKAGNRCKRKTKKTNGKCYQHA